MSTKQQSPCGGGPDTGESGHHNATPQNPLGQAALAYGLLGWPVIPLHGARDGVCTCGSPECSSPGKHPRTEHGLQDATTDERRLNQWWTCWPDANIGVATGPASGLVVLDIDGEPGEIGLSELEARHGPLPETVQQITGRGRQQFYRYPSDARVANKVDLAGCRGLDVRGDGGYVVMPPSQHVNGRLYVWEVSADPLDGCELAPVPEAWLQLLRSEGTPTARESRNGRIIQGQRNDTLTRIAGSLRRYGCDTDTITDTLQAVNARRCDPPLAGDEVLGIARSIGRYPPDSIRASIETDLARMEFPQPVPISQLGEGDSVDWLWNGYLAADHMTLFTGLWKAGKTTLLAHLLREFGKGGDLGGRVQPSRVLVVSEESRALWKRRRDEIGIGDHVHLYNRPFLGRPTRHKWECFIVHVAELVKSERYRVVVFDTISSLWPVGDENDAAKVLEVLGTLHRITGAGAAILLVHHPRKGDAGEGQAARGSGALPGFVDVIMELRRYAPQDREDRRRTLTTYSRFDETPPEAVMELTDTGYVVIGTKTEARRADRLKVVTDILPSEAPGLTVDEILAAWPAESVPKPGKRTLQGDVRQGVADGRLEAAGQGTKGKPIRYWTKNSIRAS